MFMSDKNTPVGKISPLANAPFRDFLLKQLEQII